MNKFLTMSLLAGASFLGINNAMSQNAPVPKTANAQRGLSNFKSSNFQKLSNTMQYNFYALSKVPRAKAYDLEIAYIDTNGDNIFGNSGDKVSTVSFQMTPEGHTGDIVRLDFTTGEHMMGATPNGGSDSHFIQQRKAYDKNYAGELPTLLGFIKNIYGITLNPDVDFDKKPSVNLKESLSSKANFFGGNFNHKTRQYTYYFNEKPGFTTEGDEFNLEVSFDDTNKNKIFGDRDDRVARISYSDNDPKMPLTVLDFDIRSAYILMGTRNWSADTPEMDIVTAQVEFKYKYDQPRDLIPVIERVFGFDPLNGANMNSAFPKMSDKYTKMANYGSSAYIASGKIMVAYLSGQNGVEKADERLGMLLFLDTNQNDVFGDSGDKLISYAYNTNPNSPDMVMVDLQETHGRIQKFGDTRSIPDQRADFDAQIGSMDFARLQFKKLMGFNPTP